MSSVSVPCWELRSNINSFAPSITTTTTTIDEFVLEEVDVSDLGILPGFQGGNKGKSIAGGVERTGSDLLVCQPCDEIVEVVAERKTHSQWGWSGGGEWTGGCEDCMSITRKRKPRGLTAANREDANIGQRRAAA